MSESLQYIIAVAVFMVVKDIIDTRRAGRIAAKVEKASEELQVSTETQNSKLEDIHTLVNSNMGTSLKVGAVALRRVAELTGHPDDSAAAELAENLLAEHVKKQAVVDQRKEG